MSIKGYNNKKGFGRPEFATVQSAGSDKKGIPTAQMYLYDVTPVAVAITAIAQSGDKKLVSLTIGAHSARKGDVVRMMDGDLIGWEYEVISITATAVLVYDTASNLPGDLLPAIADTLKICRWVSAKADSEGALTTSSGPVQFVRDGASQTTNEDTAVAANNRPLPAGMYVLKDGVAYPVQVDSVTPSNTVAIPVEIRQVDGTTINITAGDINVQTSHTGVNYDSMRIGDGTNLLVVNADGSINVADADALVELQNIVTALGTLNGVDFSTEAKQDSIIAALGNLLTELQNKADLAETQPVSAASLPLPTGATTEATLSAMSGKLPATLGQKTSANSLAAVLSSEQEAILQAVSDALGGPTDARQSNPDAPSATLASLIRGMLEELSQANTTLTNLNLATRNTGTPDSAQITVGVAAVRAAIDGGNSPSLTRKKLLIKPHKDNTAPIYLGGAGVTTANGLEIIGPDRLEFINDSSDYYLISSAVGQVVEIVEVT